MLMGRNSAYKVSDGGLIVAFGAFQALPNSLPVLEVRAKGAELVARACLLSCWQPVGVSFQ